MEKRVCVIQTDFHQYRPTIRPPTREEDTVHVSELCCVHLEKTQRELERQLSGLSECLGEGEVRSTRLVHHRDRMEEECNSLRQDLDQLEGALIACERDKEQAMEDLHREEEKVDLLTQQKTQLQMQVEDLECQLEQERYQREELEKNSKKIEGDNLSTQESLEGVDKTRNGPEDTIRRKDMEINNIQSKLEAEETLINGLQKKSRELQNFMEFYGERTP
ncbi:myosin-6-like [Syngnathoides biaculeatus]|uniref:myosin-6-like n=1 Tax=Syngnathoides biaculeatus TaxID=300417 RepID=UPI002ADDF32E|nr:myosin-6-like [Syngnathoides biaculeatus]